MGASPPLRLVARPAYHPYWGGGARTGVAGDMLAVSSPATGVLIANVAEASAEDVASACRAAGAAFPTWAARDRAIRKRDVVVWINLGMHHLTRAEDLPVTPMMWQSFRLRPHNFLDRNPAIDLPAEKARP